MDKQEKAMVRELVPEIKKVDAVLDLSFWLGVFGVIGGAFLQALAQVWPSIETMIQASIVPLLPALVQPWAAIVLGGISMALAAYLKRKSLQSVSAAITVQPPDSRYRQ